MVRFPLTVFMKENLGRLLLAIVYSQRIIILKLSAYTQLCSHNVIVYLILSMTIHSKEYISVVEGTAPAIVLQTFDSPNLSPPALSDWQAVQTERGEVG